MQLLIGTVGQHETTAVCSCHGYASCMNVVNLSLDRAGHIM